MSCRVFFLFVTCCPVRPYYFHKDLTIVGSYLLAACDNIQKGHYISPKQLTNWLVTLFIMSHTCDKLFNSVTPNKSKSKQLANTLWGLLVAIYRCSQAVTALQSAIGGEPLNDSLDMTSNTQHTQQRWNWQPVLFLEASSPFPNSCLRLQFALLSCKLFMLEMWRGRHCVPLQQSKSCSRLLCEYILGSAGNSESCMAGRDTAGKICWLHIISSSLLE